MMKLYKTPWTFSDSYNCHQFLKEAFPGECKVLFQRNNNTTLVLASNFAANSKALTFIGPLDSCLVLPPEATLAKKALAFSIRLNPVKAIQRKKYALEPSFIPDWVDSKLSTIGCTILSRSIINEGILRSTRKGEVCSHASVLVAGRLIVTNQSLFRSILEEGIGKAKAFGFGMLNVFEKTLDFCSNL